MPVKQTWQICGLMNRINAFWWMIEPQQNEAQQADIIFYGMYHKHATITKIRLMCESWKDWWIPDEFLT